MRVVFMGTPEFAVPSLTKLHQRGHEIALVVTQPNRPTSLFTWVSIGVN